MKLPKAVKTVVERGKIVNYLLNPAHPDNGGKEEFFEKLGFRRAAWKALAEALQTMAVRTDVAQSVKSPHGQKHVIVGRIDSPTGKSPMVRTIWIVDRGTNVARLVTAYPHQT